MTKKLTEEVTPAALAMLERLDRLWPNDVPPSVAPDIAQELALRHLVLDSTFGMQITDAGRKTAQIASPIRHGAAIGMPTIE